MIDRFGFEIGLDLKKFAVLILKAGSINFHQNTRIMSDDSREENVYMAKLAEQAERYDEVCHAPLLGTRAYILWTLQRLAGNRGTRSSRFEKMSFVMRAQSVAGEAPTLRLESPLGTVYASAQAAVCGRQCMFRAEHLIAQARCVTVYYDPVAYVRPLEQRCGARPLMALQH